MEWLIVLLILICLIAIVSFFVAVLWARHCGENDNGDKALSILERQKKAEWMDCKAERSASLLALKEERNRLLKSALEKESLNIKAWALRLIRQS